MPKIFHIDASSLKSGACLRAWWLRTVKGYQLVREFQPPLDFGNAVHRGLAAYYRDKPQDEALMEALDYYATKSFPPDDFRTSGLLMEVIASYYEQHSRAQDGIEVMGVEETFSLPIKTFANGDSVMLTGTVDLRCNYHGIRTIMDHKTSQSWKRKEYFEDFERDIQPLLYASVHADLYDVVPGFVVNGVFILSQTNAKRKSAKQVSFERSDVMLFSEERIGEFRLWLGDKKEKLLHLIEHGLGPADFDMASCKTAWGRCEFWGYCNSSEKVRSGVLGENYVVRDYNPLKFQE